MPPDDAFTLAVDYANAAHETAVADAYVLFAPWRDDGRAYMEAYLTGRLPGVFLTQTALGALAGAWQRGLIRGGDFPFHPLSEEGFPDLVSAAREQAEDSHEAK